MGLHEHEYSEFGVLLFWGFILLAFVLWSLQSASIPSFQ